MLRPPWNQHIILGKGALIREVPLCTFCIMTTEHQTTSPNYIVFFFVSSGCRKTPMQLSNKPTHTGVLTNGRRPTMVERATVYSTEAPRSIRDK